MKQTLHIITALLTVWALLMPCLCDHSEAVAAPVSSVVEEDVPCHRCPSTQPDSDEGQGTPPCPHCDDNTYISPLAELAELTLAGEVRTIALEFEVREAAVWAFLIHQSDGRGPPRAPLIIRVASPTSNQRRASHLQVWRC